MTIVQKINSSPKNAFELAYKYFSIISVLNELGLVKRDLQLLAYAVSQEKNVSDVKIDFVKNYATSLATVGNIISKLYKLSILKKEKRVVKINPAIVLDFSNDLMLGITFKHDNTKSDDHEDNR